jgi:hypothetical protein
MAAEKSHLILYDRVFAAAFLISVVRNENPHMLTF